MTQINSSDIPMTGDEASQAVAEEVYLFPTSFAQQRLWFLDQLEPASPLYNITSAVLLQGPLQLPALSRTFDEIISRHETLRTTFAVEEEMPVQVVSEARHMPLMVQDESGKEELEQERAMQEVLKGEEEAGFDLRVGPLLRVRVVKMGEERHVVVLTMHHIISDGWSMNLLINEITTLYRCYSLGQPSPLPELTIQYADYAVWQREWLQGEVLENEMQYWREQLGGELAVLELPTDHPRPPLQSFRGAHQSFALSESLSQRLKELSQREGCTLYMTLLAAFQSLLHRYSGQEDIIVGSPIAGRNRAEIEPLIGFFVNTLVMRSDLSGEPTFVELMKRVREVCLGAYAHQDVPFEKLVEELQPERDLSRSPLFQVMFVLQNTPTDRLRRVKAESVDNATLNMRPVKSDSDTAKFDLTLTIEERGQRLRGAMEYSTDLFDASTIERLDHHFVTLLDSIIASPHQPLAALNLLSEHEREQLLFLWNSASAPPLLPPASSLPRCFELQVMRSPDAPALLFHDLSLSYAHLNERANQLAHHLRSLGVGPESLVALSLLPGFDFVISLLAILKAGAAFLPIDPSVPHYRLLFMLSESNACAFITDQHLLTSSLPSTEALPTGMALINLDGEWPLISAQPIDNPVSLILPQSLAYLIYTSGSTGTPKGVLMPQQALLNHALSIGRRFALTQTDRVLQFASISFDVSLEELFPALLAGSTVVLRDEVGVLSGAEFWRMVKRQRVSVLNLVTSYWQEVMGELARRGEKVPEGVRLVVMGSEAGGRAQVERWAEVRREGVRLLNGYGPTETCVTATLSEVEVNDGAASAEEGAERQAAEGAEKQRGSLSIGRGIDGVEVYVVGGGAELAGVGMLGELYIGGEGVGRGYLGKAEMTAERFVPDGWSGREGRRLYRSGDMVRWRAGGEMEYVGRMDEQVKVRGYRIELGEIEAVLVEHAVVRGAAVIARREREGEQRVVAYIVGAESAAATEKSIGQVREHLSERLPGYMMPGAFVVLEEMPLTANGKVNRKALPEPEAERESDEEYSAPQTAIEEMVEGIWSEVLKRERVGREENFFQLGGHSLLATQVISRVREAFNLEVPLRNLFEHPTVEGLAGNIEQMMRGERGQRAPKLERVSREREIPLSFAQQRLWFLDQLEPESAFYNVPSAVRLRGSLDVQALEQTLTEIVRRHEALRTTFTSIEGEPVQVIHDAEPVSLVVEELSDEVSEEEREREAGRVVEEEARRAFDLSRGPLLRVRLLRVSEEEHIITLTMHHIISDGWSMGVLINEISTLYRSFSAGEGSGLPELPIQYADYAIWQREWLQGEVLENELQYWREQLGGELAVLELPTDHPRPPLQSFRGAYQSFALSESLSQRLKELSQREGCTLYMTLLAAFQSLLHRYSGQEDIIVGSPIAGRNRAEIEPLIGFFVNTLVMRSDMSGEPTFVELMKRVREVALGAYAHQDVPFEKLVEELQPERDLSRSPLFQVMFALQNRGQVSVDAERVVSERAVTPAVIPRQALAQAGQPLMLALMESPGQTAKFDLTLSMQELHGHLSAAFEFSTDLFDPQTIQQMSVHFLNLLGEIAGDAGQSIGRMQMLSETQRRELIEQGGGREVRYEGGERCLHRLFEEEVERGGERVAVRCGEERVSYGELNERANRLAHALMRRGVGAEKVVGICMERSIEMVVGMMGVMKAGGAYLPLDPEYPAGRLSFMLNDARPSVLLTQERLAARLPEHAAEVLCVDADRDSLALESAENPRAVTLPSNIAYIIYTSGSTGRPKGVAIEHASLLNLVRWHQRVYEVTPADRATQIAGQAFDACVWELWPYLALGASIYIIDDETRLMPEKLLATLARERITIGFLQTPLAETLLDRRWPAGLSLRTLLTGGDRLRLRPGRDAPFRLANNYGPTENTVVTTWTFVDAEAESEVPPTIGRAVDNAEAYVLDACLQLVPVGVAGELFAGGKGLARGYCERPDLTAERFIPHPLSRQPGARLYRTGDRVRLLKDGNIEFLGRLDEQVKVRGYRIELGEIEAVLMNHPAVREAAVMARTDSEGDKRLVAYIVGAESATVTEKSIGQVREHLSERLPGYMMPSAFVVLEEIPLTANGKVNRKALPEPDAERESDEEYSAPQTAIEEMVEGIWSAVLKRERVGREENFFQLGGHSLLATQVISRVREAFNLEVPLRNLFEHPTVEGLAGNIEQMLRAGREESAPKLERASREREIPLSFAQQRLWFLDQLEPESAFYNLHDAVRLRGALDIAALEGALSEIMRRHEVLRTIFGNIDGEPVQVITPPRSLSIAVEDLSLLPHEERDQLARKIINAESGEPFNLTTGPLLRIRLLKLGEEEHIITLTMHHIISDGWSMGVLINEISSLYRSFSAGEASRLPELPIQYADYAVWQREWLQGDVLEAELSYWREQLGGELAVLELPTDRPRPPLQSFRGAYHSFALSESLSQRLKELSQREGCTLYMTLLAAFQTLLHRYSGQDEIVVGSPIAGRNRAQIEPLIGFFVNTLVMRSDMSGEPTFVELMKRVREVALGAYAHQDVPFEKLVEELQPERDLSRSPLFQVMFALQNRGEVRLDAERVVSERAVTPAVIPRQALALAEQSRHQPSGQVQGGQPLMLALMESPGQTAKFDLTLSMQELHGHLSAAFEFSTDLFDPQTIQQMSAHFLNLLGEIAGDAGQSIGRMQMLSETQRRELIEQGAGREVRYEGGERCLHRLFEEEVERGGERVAVRCGEERVSYGELNERANRLAHALMRRGVGAEKVVGICMERSIEMVVGMMGVMKAGGAYLPLDPGYPPERLKFMMEDSGVAVLLTQERLLTSLPVQVGEMICLDREWDAMWAESVLNPVARARVENMAYVIYTSGSTGIPKAVVITHEAISNHMQWFLSAFPLTAADRVLQKTPFSFDASVWEFYAPLLCGAQLVMAAPGLHQDPAGLAQFINQAEVTVLQVVPALLRVLVEELVKELRAPGTLRLLFVGGEPLPGALARRAAEVTGAEVYNLYGPTEATIDTTFERCGREAGAGRAEEERGMERIGKAISNVRVYIVDRVGEIVPEGVSGELWIGGRGLGRGYLGRAGETAERYVPDGYGKEAGGRLYRSGDVCRYVRGGGGEIEYIGRVDEQVKVRGYRIELGEIETKLMSHPAIREAAVMVREEAGEDQRLVAYFVADVEGAAGSVLTSEQLREYLRERLPEYMIPGAFVRLQEMPLSPSGKVNRRRLLEERVDDGERPGKYVVPRTLWEFHLARMWEEILGVEKVGVRDNFFELGGHSLLATRLMTRIRERTGRALRLAVLFEAQTVEKLASHLSDENAADTPGPLVALQKGGEKRPFFCVHPVGGNVLCYAELARGLGDEQPFYGLQAQSLEGSRATPLSIEEMARFYLKAVRAAQPEGPYLLGGWSLGGLIAFEMARQLERDGELVSLLALLDAAPATDAERKEEEDETALLASFARDVGLAPDKWSWNAEPHTRVEAKDRLSDLHAQALRAGLIPPDLGLDELLGFFDMFKRNVRARKAYKPEAHRTRAVLFKSCEGSEIYAQDATMGWSEIIPEDLEVHQLPGDHYEMMREPHVKILADKLRELLDRAQETDSLLSQV